MQPLDIQSLLGLVPSIPDAPEDAGPGLTMGHIHLHVSELDVGRRFYEGGIGFEEQMAIPTAAFASANGYHHHVAFNTWKGIGAPSVEPGSVGLKSWTLNVDAGDHLQIITRLEQLGYLVKDHNYSGQAVAVTDSDGISAVIQVSQ
jgi:catechol 2,3-dioxygenase